MSISNKWSRGQESQLACVRSMLMQLILVRFRNMTDSGNY